MAAMQALLQIKADVTGEGQVNALGRAIGGIKQKATEASVGLRGIASSAGGLSGAMGTLVPLLSGAGLVAMGKSAIDAADDMNDMAQRTGVSVEQLSRFKQAADASGTSIGAVGGALTKLNRNLASGNDATANALKSLGISATDATGKLRSADQIMLDVANKFQSIQDPAQKAALATKLFGKSGADLIPLLNGGGDAIKNLSATMSTDFAQGADQLNDKVVAIQTKMTELGVKIGTSLMPALNIIADGIVNLANWFGSLPGPVQAVIGGVTALAVGFVALAPAISAIISIFGSLSGMFAAGTFGASIIGALGSILTFVTGTLIPGLLAVVTGPVGLTVLLVAAIVALFIAFREPIMNFLTWVWENLVGGFQKIADWYMNVYVKFWVDLWANYIVKPITDFLSWFGNVFMKGWEAYVKSIRGIWDAAAGFFTQAWQKAGGFITGIWNGIVNGLRGIVNGFFNAFFGQINSAIRAINILITAFNQLPGPDIPFIPQVPIPRFAEGGVVDRPTLAMVGEGGEREYIIPESKMAGAAAAYLGGARGASVVGPSTINVTTGPVLQQQGQNWVTMADLQQAMRATEAATLQRIRTPAGRAALGIR